MDVSDDFGNGVDGAGEHRSLLCEELPHGACPCEWAAESGSDLFWVDLGDDVLTVWSREDL